MKVQGVILDWAGTVVDYGCFAPVAAFKEVFASRELEVTNEEVRKPMGMLKKDHLRTMLQMPRIEQMWVDKYDRKPEETDVDELYEVFEPSLFAILHNYVAPIPGSLEMIARLRDQGIKIGSSTGYTREMMDVVEPKARELGYAPDYVVTPNEVPGGRPYPWMIYRNTMELGVYPLAAVVKCGDTIVDIGEGVNAGVWTVGVLKGSNELGLTEEEVTALEATEEGRTQLQQQLEAIRTSFLREGADYVIESIGELDQVVTAINERLARGEQPILQKQGEV
ncbi:phosphonoacetaldehyde hydrolase [Paenibacillus sp. N1-5-1-14]|nr:phosphonoacetaldehyde hydrolase [Paenibacillus radicibacter]